MPHPRAKAWLIVARRQLDPDRRAAAMRAARYVHHAMIKAYKLTRV
jgi:hypothetical protein